MSGGVTVAVILIALLAELHLLAVIAHPRAARRRALLGPLLVTLYIAFAAVVAVTIGEALSRQ